MTKICCSCKKNLPLSNFYGESKSSDGKGYMCISCKRDYIRNWRHRKGIQKPASQNRTCPSFLGVHVAEKVLSDVFKNVERSPYGTRGYDFVCGKGFKVDVKSSTRNVDGNWRFTIHRNRIADYFALLAFDSINDLNPLHLWLIPGSDLQHMQLLVIVESTINNWKKYEKPVDKVIACCNIMKTSDTKGL